MKKRLYLLLKVLLWTLLALAMGFAALWWRFRPDEQGRVIPLFETIDMAVLPQFIDAIPHATTTVLYEGLPHQGWEVRLFESERDAKPHVEFHGHLFYAEPCRTCRNHSQSSHIRGVGRHEDVRPLSSRLADRMAVT